MQAAQAEFAVLAFPLLALLIHTLGIRWLKSFFIIAILYATAAIVAAGTVATFL